MVAYLRERLLAVQQAKWALLNWENNPSSRLWRMRAKNALDQMEKLYALLRRLPGEEKSSTSRWFSVRWSNPVRDV